MNNFFIIFAFVIYIIHQNTGVRHNSKYASGTLSNSASDIGPKCAVGPKYITEGFSSLKGSHAGKPVQVHSFILTINL